MVCDPIRLQTWTVRLFRGLLAWPTDIVNGTRNTRIQRKMVINLESSSGSLKEPQFSRFFSIFNNLQSGSIVSLFAYSGGVPFCVPIWNRRFFSNLPTTFLYALCLNSEFFNVYLIFRICPHRQFYYRSTTRYGILFWVIRICQQSSSYILCCVGKLGTL